MINKRYLPPCLLTSGRDASSRLGSPGFQYSEEPGNFDVEINKISGKGRVFKIYFKKSMNLDGGGGRKNA